MTHTPEISIVVPTYRRPKLLARALASLSAQTFQDWEAIVVDDEPSKGNSGVVDRSGDNRIRYVAHSENAGLSSARNTGIAESRGRYVCFLDDDDEFLPNKLQAQFDLLEANPEVGVAICHEIEVGPSGNKRVRAIDLNGDAMPALLKTDIVHAQMLMVRREILDLAGGFDVELPHHEDFDISLSLARESQYLTCPEPLLIRYTADSEMSRSIPNRIVALERIIAKHPEIHGDRRAHSRWLDRIARHHAQLGDTERWRQSTNDAIRRDPRNLRAVIARIAGPRNHVRLVKVRGRATVRFRQLASCTRGWSRNLRNNRKRRLRQ